MHLSPKAFPMHFCQKHFQWQCSPTDLCPARPWCVMSGGGQIGELGPASTSCAGPAGMATDRHGATVNCPALYSSTADIPWAKKRMIPSSQGCSTHHWSDSSITDSVKGCWTKSSPGHKLPRHKLPQSQKLCMWLCVCGVYEWVSMWVSVCVCVCVSIVLVFLNNIQ